MELQRFRSPRRLATMVATIVPIATPQRARGPKAISTPAATPAAGQNTATPSGVSRERLSFADRIYRLPTTTASQAVELIHHARAPLSSVMNERRFNSSNCIRCPPAKPDLRYRIGEAVSGGVEAISQPANP